MSSVYCQIKLELTPYLMQAAKLEAARRNLTIEEMIMKYLATFLPDNIEQALLECQHSAEECYSQKQV